ncbi:MAG: AmmeMemoRadiSam system radical SAM enzyme [Chloroflexota bacterium]
MRREAILYERLEGSAVRCHVCQWDCRIAEGKLGVCQTRLNEGGVLYTLLYGEASSINVDPIEKKPLFHFFPTSRVFSLGTWGCNFRCRHCQNWQISYARPADGGWVVEGAHQGSGRQITPAETVALARRNRCAGIAWTYNEPGIWLEQTLESARLAREAGLYTAYVTNGFLSQAALDAVGPYLDAYRVDIKGFGDGVYRELAGVPRSQGILRVAERARHHWGMHLEVVTNVVPALNDDPSQLESIARWIAESLGPETPWHVTRFFPHADMSHLPPTPVETLLRAREIGLQAGLSFVYVGNLPGTDAANTRCPGCGELAIRRSGYRTELLGVAPSGRCRRCGGDLNLRGC